MCAARRLGQRLTSFMRRTFWRQSSSLMLPPAQPPAVTRMASQVRPSWRTWWRARRLLSATGASRWRRMLLAASWWGRKSTLTTWQGENRESTLEPSCPLPPMNSTFFMTTTTIIMHEQQHNEFITPEELQRQYLIDLLALKRKRNHREVARDCARTIIDRVSAKLQEGVYALEPVALQVEALLEEKELSESAKRLLSNQKRREERERQNQLLYPRGGSPEPASQPQYPPNILSLQRHREFVKEIRLEKAERTRKISQLKEREATLKQRNQSQLQQAEQQERLSSIEQKKQQIQQNLIRMRENHERLLLSEQETKGLVTRMRNKKRLHDHLREVYEQNFVLPAIQENKKALEERRENSRLSLEEIENHEKEYLEWKKKSQGSLEKTPTKPPYHPPAHSDKINKILKEEQQRGRLALEQQKQEVRAKMERVSNYTALLKQRYPAHQTPASKTIATDRHNNRTHTDVNSRQSEKRNNLGNRYLEDARKLLRKRAKTEEGQPMLKQDPPRSHQKTMSANLDLRRREEGLQRSKRAQIEERLNCADCSPEEKLKRLREADTMLSAQVRKREEKMRVRFSRRDNECSVELLLAAVKAKMNLLHCYDDALP